MKKFRMSKTVLLTGLASILVLGLLFFSYPSVVVQQTNRAVSFLSRILHKPFGLLRQAEVDFSNLFYAYEENKDLKQRLYTMDEEVNQVESLKKENEELRQQLGLQSQFKDRKVIQAAVIDRLPATWANRLLIDKGSKEGLVENMYVVAHGGLVGQVLDVSEDTSVVALLTSKQESLPIPVKINTGAKDIFGIIKSYDPVQELVTVSQLNAGDEIPKGARVMTSGLGNMPVKDIPLGQVESSKQNSHNLEREVYVKLSATSLDFSTVSVVGQ